MKPKEISNKEFVLVKAMELRRHHYLKANGYVVEKVDTTLKPCQEVTTDTQGRVVGQWDDRMYHRVVLVDHRSSRRMYMYPQLNLAIFVDGHGREFHRTDVNDRYEVCEWR